MASGVPVISTELGTGTSFVNVHGETGFVVAPKNPGALQEAVTRLLIDGALRKNMGQTGRKRAISEFTRETMVARVFDFYNDVLIKKNCVCPSIFSR